MRLFQQKILRREGNSMSKKVVVISTSPRKNSNSDILADEFIKGAIAGGNTAEKVVLRDKQIDFCRGCLACWELKKCVHNDDASDIAAQVVDADVVVFATPIYFYEMSGQMKTILDRVGSLYMADYKFRDVYLLATSANPDPLSMDTAIDGLNGWIKCFEKTKLCGVVKGVGVSVEGEINANTAILKAAYDMGKAI